MNAETSRDIFLEVKNLSKKYPGILALDTISCGFEKGKIHALVGKNGSGKSTFVNLVSGIIKPTSGHILLENSEVHFASANDAIKRGIAVVHQEMSLTGALSVMENIFLGRLKIKKRGIAFVDWKAIEKEARAILERIGVSISPNALVSSLSVGQQQQIEIAKAIAEEPKLLILDEPTSALVLKEVQTLFEIMKNLAKSGVTMIYISHRLQELKDIADTVTVLCDGRYMDTLSVKEASREQIVHLMFGNVSHFHKTERASSSIAGVEKEVFAVKSMTRKPFFKNISFSLRRGEILGIAGILGSGRTELLRSIFGLDAFDAGDVFVYGQKVGNPSPQRMKRLGLSYVSEDRKEEGLVQILSSHENLVIASMHEIAYKHFFITKQKEAAYVKKQIADLHVKVSNVHFPVSSLSGGNQQKIVVGNWLNTMPKIMLFDEPSRGIDVEAKQHIFRIMWNEKEMGTSAIVVSSELEELLEICDRILILKDGTFVKEVYPQNTSVNQLYNAV